MNLGGRQCDRQVLKKSTNFYFCVQRSMSVALYLHKDPLFYNVIVPFISTT